MIRVAFDTTPLMGQRTGIGHFVDRALRGLAVRRDLAMRAFAVTWNGRAGVAATLPPSVSAVRIPMAAWPLQQAWRRWDGPIIEWWTGPVDVVHGTSFVVPPAARAAEVVTVHDLAFLLHPDLCEPVTRRYEQLIRRALARGALVHAVSHTMAHEIVDVLGVGPERVRVVGHGVDAEPPGGPVFQKPARPYVLAIGRSEPRKDLPALVRAFDTVAAGFPDLDLVIAGPVGSGEEALQASIAATPYRHRIRRVGWVGEQEKRALLHGAWVFAYPSLYEGFGLPTLEAMVAGVPVLATAAGAIPEVVGDAARLTPVGDDAALAEGLAGLAGDTEERARLVKAGHARAAEFSWDRCAAGLERLYVDAAGGR